MPKLTNQKSVTNDFRVASLSKMYLATASTNCHGKIELDKIILTILQVYLRSIE